MQNFFFANPLFVVVEFHLRRHLALEIVISLVGCFDVSQSRVQLVVDVKDPVKLGGQFEKPWG